MAELANLELEYRDDSLVIRVHGRGIIEKMPETFQAMADAIRARPVRATLIDLRDISGPITFLDRYQLGEMAGRYLPRILLAALMHKDQADRKHIGQLVALNRGANVEIFTDQAKADAWLKKVPARNCNPTGKPT
jgi:hypothetical protein